MKIYLSILILFSMMTNAQNDFKTPFENGNGNQTATYEETIAYFQDLDEHFESVEVREMGQTDSGEPLHIVIFNAEGKVNFDKITAKKAVLLINNGIHPGEPDGIDATMMLYRDLAMKKTEVPKNVVIVNIPIYNIGGALNRNSHSRANQNGPESYGFRGNARNYDLNRDFLKSDTRNARSFAEIFHLVKPDLLIDNHVSNGADYQYTFTYIATQYQKLGGALGTYWKDELLPAILRRLNKKQIDAVPYVNIHDEKPDDGFEAFMDSPRYSTGYASMFNVMGAMPETHMLKNYASRVHVTYEFMLESLDYLDQNYKQVKALKQQNNQEHSVGSRYTLQWEIDRDQRSEIPFLGYEGGYKASDISGKPRLYYDRTKPFKKQVSYYTEFKPKVRVTIPQAYIIPKSWWNVVDLLKLNNIEMTPLTKDAEFIVESYRIGTYKTATYAYEGHYPHTNVEVIPTTEKVLFHTGDLLIDTQQPGIKYLLETLEPQAADSYFSWNFFDSILQQKEHYSAYVFEDLAREILDKDLALKAEFDKLKRDDNAFAESGEAQLDWVYRHSEYYEKSHLQYPVYRKMH
ncbi:MAG TPA: M14 family metallopeptidase [Flavobacterium sp.]|jgi:hypothetical protein